MKSVYIFFSTIDIGGAEKRFAGLWRSFQNDNSNIRVKLVVHPLLKKRLADIDEIVADHENIIEANFEGKNFLEYRKKVRLFLRKNTKPNDILHFVGISPLLIFSKRKILFSITNSDLNLVGTSNKNVILSTSLLADSIDVLDPDIYHKFLKLFFWKRKKIFRTTNSFCDTELFKPVPFSEKKDWIVFLGRFMWVKQIEQIVDALPLVFKKLRLAGKENVTVFLLGIGELSEKIKDKLNSPDYKNLPVIAKFEKEPFKILNSSKIFLSLQLYNNYPSKSLLEAMGAGNIPLVTDVGQTRWIAKSKFSYYVPEKFTSVDLANAICDIFKMDSSQWEEKMNEARQEVVHNHTLDKMKKYYEKIYADL